MSPPVLLLFTSICFVVSASYTILIQKIPHWYLLFFKIQIFHNNYVATMDGKNVDRISNLHRKLALFLK